MWGAMWMIDRHVVRQPRLRVAQVMAWIAPALYIAISFECGSLVSAKVLGVNRARIVDGLRVLPSPFAFPLRSELFGRINVHIVKHVLFLWLVLGQCSAGLDRVFARNVRCIRCGKLPVNDDVRYLWTRVQRDAKAATT